MQRVAARRNAPGRWICHLEVHMLRQFRHALLPAYGRVRRIQSLRTFRRACEEATLGLTKSTDWVMEERVEWNGSGAESGAESGVDGGAESGGQGEVRDFFTGMVHRAYARSAGSRFG